MINHYSSLLKLDIIGMVTECLLVDRIYHDISPFQFISGKIPDLAKKTTDAKKPEKKGVTKESKNGKVL